MSFPVIDSHYYAPKGVTEGHQRAIKSDLSLGLRIRVHSHAHGNPCNERCEVREPEVERPDWFKI